jgi:RNA polymerase sigma factor (sigma-70 family)
MRQCADGNSVNAAVVDEVALWDGDDEDAGSERDGVGGEGDGLVQVSGELMGPIGSLQRKNAPQERETVEGALSFSLAGLSDPDPARREAEWMRFFAAYYEPLMKAMAREEPDYDRRSDLAQRAFKRAHAAIVVNNYPLLSEAKALPWLRMIAHRLLLDLHDAEKAHARMLETHQAHLAADEELQLHAENALDRLCAEDVDDGRFPISSAAIKLAVSHMTPRDQEIIRLRTQTDLEWADIAAEVKMTDAGVRQRFSRLRGKLRRLPGTPRAGRRRKKR